MNSSTSPVPYGMEVASDALIEIMRELLSAYLILCIFGFMCSLLNIPLLFVLFGSRRLRADSKLLICLAVGDLINCIALSLMGFDRYILYIYSIPTKLVPLVTSLSCASKPYMWFRIIGNLWPPSVQMVMGLERVTACVAPVIYIRYIRDRSIYLCAVTVLAVVPFFIVGIVLAVTNGTKGYVKFDCGEFLL
ncbi:unnamed protein product [Heligmosomoides polygyrus]|uniref:G_PROTEIN_RECEP_F1_2 domain-containing protein n=1 Tax=Heligmosomoides polygyrus TaxID=6339 RepID=A0A183FS30_HELPZ|nr:unnamed protein product [Heligmosomoides polygyrus]